MADKTVMVEGLATTISYGIEPSSGKWKAQFCLPNGEYRSTTDGYDTLEELKQVVEEWITANGFTIQRIN